MSPRAFVDASPPLTLVEALQNQTVDTLRPMMALLSVPKPRPTRKADMVEMVHQRLEEGLRDIWELLDDIERLAVREAVHGNGLFDGARFHARYGASPKGLGPVARYGSLVTENERLGLLFFRCGPWTSIPPDLAACLREFSAPPPPVTLATADALPETAAVREPWGAQQAIGDVALTVRHMETAAAADLRAVLRLVGNGAVAVSPKTRRPTAGAVRRLAEVLHGGDFFDPLARKEKKWDQVPGAIRAFAWPWLLQAAKLAQLRGTRLELTRQGRAALARPVGETLRRIWESWCDTDLLDEFNRIDTVKGQFRGAGRRAMTVPGARRDVVANALAECPVGRWVHLDEFGRFMRAASFDFAVTEDPWRLYVTESEYGSLGYDGFHGWDILQGRYVRCLLFEYAATLGMVDVAFIPPENARDDFRKLWGTDDLAYLSRYDGLLYFRLNRLGAYCLELAQDYEPPKVSARTPLKVFPDRRVVATGTPSAEERIVLDTYASAETDGTWRLDAEKILLALEGGGDVDELRGFLAARDEQPLPETVDGLLQRASRGASALKMAGEAFLIECADADIAAALVADRRVAKMCLRAGERHVVVRAKSERAFRKAVRAMGFGLRD